MADNKKAVQLHCFNLCVVVSCENVIFSVDVSCKICNVCYILIIFVSVLFKNMGKGYSHRYGVFIVSHVFSYTFVLDFISIVIPDKEVFNGLNTLIKVGTSFKIRINRCF